MKIFLCSKLKIDDIYGIDVNKQLINFGNNQIYNLLKFDNRLSFKSESEMFKTIIHSKAEILSAMGVIEHLRYPHKLFQAFRKSKIKYLYYSVPMFSMSALLSNGFKQSFSSTTVRWTYSSIY